MKNILALAMILFVGMSFAQDKQKKVRTISFKTSAVCGECKERIENELNYTKGVIFAELDLDNKVLTVKYKTKHINEYQVKGLVSRIGYDAGDVPRNKEAFNKLPKCCKSEGHCKR
ncbi:MAG: heavy-metal-associated domain-containing protein [Crocinitomicaceae bacterium]|nr:heavy-metal-associated domain-containing protein [Crocinitomicaceae bacterium]